MYKKSYCNMQCTKGRSRNILACLILISAVLSAGFSNALLQFTQCLLREFYFDGYVHNPGSDGTGIRLIDIGGYYD